MSIIQSKTVDLYQKLVEFEPKTSFSIQIRRIFDKIDLSRSEFKFKFEFGPRFRIGFVATSNRTAGIESQKSIKSRFDHD